VLAKTQATAQEAPDVCHSQFFGCTAKMEARSMDAKQFIEGQWSVSSLMKIVEVFGHCFVLRIVYAPTR